MYLQHCKNLFNKNGYVHIKKVLSSNQKINLLKIVNNIETNNTVNTPYIHKYELDKFKKPVICRTEYIINHAK